MLNAVLGTITAWVLVRDDFRGKSVVNAIIDLPFALPTIVAGLTLLALYGPTSPVGINVAFSKASIVLALMFVTLPFVVRTVQPVLQELDTELEEAAHSLGASNWTTFRRVVLPNILPGILSGVALAFAKAVGEFGSLVIITGNIPFETEVSSVYIFGRIESGDSAAAAAVAVVLLAISFRALLAIGGIGGSPEAHRDEARRSTMSAGAGLPAPERTLPSLAKRLGLRFVALGYLAVILVGPLALVFWRTFEDGFAPAWDALTTPETINAFKLTLIITAIAVPVNTVFGIVCALAIVRRRFPGKGLLNAFIDLPLALSPVVVGLSLFLLYGQEGWFGGWLAEHGIEVLFALPAMVIATIFVSLFVGGAVRRARGRADAARGRRRAGAGRRTLGAGGWQTFWRITLPSIRWAVIYGVILTTARCLGEYGAVAVVSGPRPGETETATLRVQERYEAFDLAGAYAISIVLALIAILVLVAMTVIRPKGGRLDVDPRPQRLQALRRLRRPRGRVARRRERVR